MAQLYLRFIPARAGNIVRSANDKNFRTVHPRACGEHPATSVLTANARGSSPRVRGTSNLCNRRYSYQRFIPARAGNIEDYRRRQRHLSVHPRACGEH